jgi:hypothetical protein
MFLCSHALGKKGIDAVALAPRIILPNLLQGGSVVTRSQFGLEAVGEVALGRDVGKKMGEIRKVGFFRTDGATERDDSKVVPHDQVHGCDCSHCLFQRESATNIDINGNIMGQSVGG